MFDVDENARRHIAGRKWHDTLFYDIFCCFDCLVLEEIPITIGPISSNYTLNRT
jgi:hypothetical protein